MTQTNPENYKCSGGHLYVYWQLLCVVQALSSGDIKLTLRYTD